MKNNEISKLKSGLEQAKFSEGKMFVILRAVEHILGKQENAKTIAGRTFSTLKDFVDAYGEDEEKRVAFCERVFTALETFNPSKGTLGVYDFSQIFEKVQLQDPPKKEKPKLEHTESKVFQKSQPVLDDKKITNQKPSLQHTQSVSNFGTKKIENNEDTSMKTGSNDKKAQEKLQKLAEKFSKEKGLEAKQKILLEALDVAFPKEGKGERLFAEKLKEQLKGKQDVYAEKLVEIVFEKIKKVEIKKQPVGEIEKAFNGLFDQPSQEQATKVLRENIQKDLGNIGYKLRNFQDIDDKRHMLVAALEEVFPKQGSGDRDFSGKIKELLKNKQDVYAREFIHNLFDQVVEYANNSKSLPQKQSVERITEAFNLMANIAGEKTRKYVKEEEIQKPVKVKNEEIQEEKEVSVEKALEKLKEQWSNANNLEKKKEIVVEALNVVYPKEKGLLKGDRDFAGKLAKKLPEEGKEYHAELLVDALFDKIKDKKQTDTKEQGAKEIEGQFNILFEEVSQGVENNFIEKKKKLLEDYEKELKTHKEYCKNEKVGTVNKKSELQLMLQAKEVLNAVKQVDGIVNLKEVEEKGRKEGINHYEGVVKDRQFNNNDKEYEHRYLDAAVKYLEENAFDQNKVNNIYDAVKEWQKLEKGKEEKSREKEVIENNLAENKNKFWGEKKPKDRVTHFNEILKNKHEIASHSHEIGGYQKQIKVADENINLAEKGEPVKEIPKQIEKEEKQAPTLPDWVGERAKGFAFKSGANRFLYKVYEAYENHSGDELKNKLEEIKEQSNMRFYAEAVGKALTWPVRAKVRSSEGKKFTEGLEQVEKFLSPDNRPKEGEKVKATDEQQNLIKGLEKVPEKGKRVENKQEVKGDDRTELLAPIRSYIDNLPEGPEKDEAIKKVRNVLKKATENFSDVGASLDDNVHKGMNNKQQNLDVSRN